MSTDAPALRPRFIIPVSEELRADVMDFATENKIKVAELGRKLFEEYVQAEKKRRRRAEFRETLLEYYDVIREVQHEWRHTEVENWPEDE